MYAFATALFILAAMPAETHAQSAPASGGAVEGALVEDLALANRILVDQGVLDAFGHVSIRHPHSANRFLMSRSLAPALVTPQDIMEFDLDANAVDQRDRALFLERFIHSEIYKARSDVMAVVHSHSPAVIPFGVAKTPMQAVYHNAAFLAAGVPVFEIRSVAGTTDMLIRNREIGQSAGADTRRQAGRAYARTWQRRDCSLASTCCFPRGLHRDQCSPAAAGDRSRRTRHLS